MKNNYLTLFFLLFLSVRSLGQAPPTIEVTIPNPLPACLPGDCTDLLAVYPPVKQTTGYTVGSITYFPQFPFIGGTEIPATNDDIWKQFNLPFPFCFYGVYYDKVLVGSNGILSFDFISNVPDVNGQCAWAYTATVPSVTFPERNAIYGVYQDTDISPGATGDDAINDNIQKVNYYLLDTGPNAYPNRVFVANWNELPQFSCHAGSGVQTSQIVLYESTNIIDVYVSKRTPCNSWNSGSGLIGIQNQAGTNAVVPPGRNTGTWSTTNEAWRFTPNGANSPSTLTWWHNGSPVPGSTNVNPLNVCLSGPEAYTAVVEYTRCDNSTVSASETINVDVAPPLPVLDPQDITICSSSGPPYTVPSIDQDAYILSSVPDPANYIIKYYEDAVDAANGAPTNINYIDNTALTPYTFNAPLPKTIYVRLESLNTGCVNIRPFDINIGAPSGTIDYGTGPYCNNLTTNIAVNNNALTAGGQYTATPAGLNINATTGAISPGSAANTYTVKYEIPAAGACPAYVTTAPVTIIACTCTVIASSTAETLCEDTVLNSMTFTVSGGANSATISAGALPVGVTGSFASGTYTLSGTPTTPGVYDFTVSVTAGTDTCTAAVRITVNAQPVAGTNGSTSVCDSSTAAIDLYSLITGEQAGGTWTRSSGTGGAFNAAAGTFTPAPGANNSVFTYTLTATAPCNNVSSTATVNITAQPNAGTNGTAVTVCDDSSAAIDLFSLINGEQTGGTWTRTTGTGGVFNAAAGTFTPALGASNSTFTYTLTGAAPCVNSTSVATVNINPKRDAGTDGSVVVCDSSTAAINLFTLITGEQSGGVWTRTSGTGGTFNAAAGTFTPASGATSSDFTYTLTGATPCANDSSLATVTINAQPNAGTDGTTVICDNDTTAVDLFSLITGEQTGGTWTRTTGTGGTFNAAAGTFTAAAGAGNSTFTYTLAGTTPCINDSSLATVNINPQRNAGTNGNTMVCDSSTTAINLSGLITGEETGGTWTRTSGTGGTFNAAAGTFTPAPGATTSDFTYTLTGTAPCPNATSVATVNINAQPNAGVDGNVTVCDSDATAIDLFTLITGEQTGGTWTRTTGTGGTFNAAAGTFTPALGASNSTFTYTLTGVAPCVNDNSLATVNVNPQRNAGTNGNTTVCDSSTTAIDLFSLITGEQSGGTWVRTSGSGGTFNAAAGTFTPAAGASTSDFTYTLTGTLPCPNVSSVATVNINAQPNAGVDGSTAVCDSSTTIIDLFSLITGEQTGGVWSRTSGTGGNFNATAGTFTPATGATTSVFTYLIAGVTPCIDDSSTATINITAQPQAGTNGTPLTVCETSTTAIDLFSLINGEQSGGVWTRTTGTGGIFNAIAGTYTPAIGASNSTFTYTLTGVAPCVNSTSVATININAQPDAGVNGTPTTVCDSSSASIDLFSLINGEQTGGTWTRTTGIGGAFNAAAGTFVPAPGASSSTFTYTIVGTAPCVNSSSVATVNINAQPNAGTDGNTLVCDDSSATVDLFGLITGEQAGGIWARTTGTGGTFNAVAGTFTPAPGASSSTFTYTLTGTAPCIIDSSEAKVNINAKPNAGTDGAPVTICDSSTAAINLYSLINGEQTGGSWTRTTGTGGTFNAAAGTFTPAAGATNSTFTYTITGTAPCPNVTSLATININAQPNAGTNGNTAVCETNAAAIDLFGLISGEQAGGTWTRTTGTGGIFNATAGTFSPAVGATSSTFTYTIIGTAPCVNSSSVATITVNPSATIVLTSGNRNQTICINTPMVTTVYTIGNGATGALITSGGLPAGVNGVFSASSGTFTVSGTPTGSGAFSYEISTTGGCPSTPITGTINVDPKVSLVLDSDASTPFQTRCVNQSILNITYLVGNGAAGAVATGLPPGLIQNYNAATHLLTISGTVTSVGVYNYDVTTSGGCGQVILSGILTVNQNATITLTSSSMTQSVCVNDAITDMTYQVANGATSAAITAGTVPAGIQGSFSGGFFTISGTPTESGTFTFTVSAVGGCSPGFTQGTIVVNPLPSITLQQDGFICVDDTGNPIPGATFTLDTHLSTANHTFIWSDGTGVIAGQTGSSYIASEPGLYSVQVTNTTTGCINSESATIAPSLPPVAVFASASSYFSESQVITVTVVPTGLYEYQLDNGAFQDSNEFTNLTSGTHTITVRDKFRCGSIDTTVRIIDYPKFFTPNGDGYNDTWNIPDLADQPASKIFIFDRYGKLLKEISPKGSGWDGTFNAQLVPATDYWFKVFFKESGVDKEFKSHFSLKR